MSQPLSPAIDVSIIIVNYHTEALITACIHTILHHTTGLSYEIIVVDNASRGNLQASLTMQFAHQVKVVSLSQNVGFGRANNAGAQQAMGRHVLFLNPDTLLQNNAIKLLSDYLDAHRSVGVCGGNLVDASQKPACSFRRLYPGICWQLSDLSAHALDRLFYGSSWQFNHTEKPLAVAYICGADLMIRRDVLTKVGGFAPDFFMFYEETDLCRRITKAGYQVVCVPEATIQHIEGGATIAPTSAKVNYRRLALAEHGRYIYCCRHLNWCHRLLTHAVYAVSLCILGLIAAILRRPNAIAFLWRLRIFSQLAMGRTPHIFQGLSLKP